MCGFALPPILGSSRLQYWIDHSCTRSNLVGTDTAQTSHWVTGALCGHTASTSHLVVESSMGTHTAPTLYWIEDSSMGTYILPTLHWIEDSSMGIHIGPTSHWVEQADNSSMGTHTGPTSHWEIAPWGRGHTLD